MLLRIDAPGELAKLLGERFVLNARQGGISLRIANKNQEPRAASAGSAEARLFVWRFASLSPRAELDALKTALQLDDFAEHGGMGPEMQQVYASERKILEDRRVVPLVILPEYLALSANIRDWMPARWGEWRLADAWLDASAAVFALPPSETPSWPPAGAIP